jgi:hypothetical protein
MWTLKDKYYGSNSPYKVAEEVLKRLARYKPFVYKRSQDGRSVYIHFKGLPNNLDHKLRVSNHDERDRYGYKWQLRVDGVKNVRYRKPQRRYYENIEVLVTSFEAYYNRVESLNSELLSSIATQQLISEVI